MSLGGVFTAIIAIALFSFLFIGIGYGMQKLVDKNNDMIDDDEPYSEDRKNAMDTYFTEWYAFPAIFAILMFIGVIIISIKDKSDTI